MSKMNSNRKPARADFEKTSRKNARQSNVVAMYEKVETIQKHAPQFKRLDALNFIQGEYQEAIRNNDIVFGIGSAGTGKTTIAANYAAEQLCFKRIDKVYITRPNVESGPGVGFLPGSLEDKYAPFLQPFESAFKKSMGLGFYNYCLKSKKIEAKPLGFMRGDTFEDCVVLVDEAQNCTKKDFKLMLSRIGNNCKIIISGDNWQSDIPNSGLIDAVERLSSVADIQTVNFLDADIVRSEMCKAVIMAYRD